MQSQLFRLAGCDADFDVRSSLHGGEDNTTTVATILLKAPSGRPLSVATRSEPYHADNYPEILVETTN
jgi:hypothetical protein